ncbi:hypothetical protein CEXT_211331 [Caerostris extrusa]|uniref:Uncharacterized protein n=1 Tax=Caerostris extrusa TaxID=172846 RepID=A0AAV4XBP6_CAEEX|nr:hypothetical protein CEXT_211331 [Caerostris extrusa]
MLSIQYLENDSRYLSFLSILSIREDAERCNRGRVFCLGEAVNNDHFMSLHFHYIRGNVRSRFHCNREGLILLGVQVSRYGSSFCYTSPCHCPLHPPDDGVPDKWNESLESAYRVEKWADAVCYLGIHISRD